MACMSLMGAINTLRLRWMSFVSRNCSECPCVHVARKHTHALECTNMHACNPRAWRPCSLQVDWRLIRKDKKECKYEHVSEACSRVHTNQCTHTRTVPIEARAIYIIELNNAQNGCNAFPPSVSITTRIEGIGDTGCKIDTSGSIYMKTIRVEGETLHMNRVKQHSRI